jgi:tRNA A-37 threonylcarbamoyl transferase component Bud32
MALDHRDEAILATLVRRGWLAPGAAEQFRRTFQGAAGTMGGALVQVRAISPQQLEAAILELSGGQRPPDAPLQPSWGGTTPGSAYFRSAPPGSASSGPPASSHGSRPPGNASSGARTNPLRTPSSGGASVKGGVPEIPGITILEELGRGGMGAVYRGRVDETKRIVAIKVLLAVNEARIKRFEREAQAMERLKHEHVIELVATGLDQRGMPYLAMDFVTGGDLAQLKDEGVGLQQALDIVSKVTRAIDYAHGEGILHRDLKPANVLIDAAGEPRVTDFGLAKILDRETQLTKTNAILGTPFYMSPEQVRGEAMDEKTDVYALGVLLYELLTNEYPCAGDNRIELYQSIQHQRPTPPRELVPAVPEVVSELILWTLEKEANDRPSGKELGDALSDLAAGRSPRVLPPALRNPGLKRTLRVAAVLVGLLLVIGAGVGIMRYRAHAERERVATEALSAVKEASKGARRARARRDVAELQREVEAHRQVAAALAAVPTEVAEQGRALAEGSLERRPLAIRELIKGLVAADRAADALAPCRELIGILPPAEAELVAAEVLSRHFTSAAEAYAAITRIRTRGTRPDEARSVAEALLRLERPRQAAEVLAKAPNLAVLRARAWRLAGEAERASQDLQGAQADPRDPLALAVERARVEGDLGRPGPALTQLERVRGSNDARWHQARGALNEQLGEPAAALEAYAEAAKLGAHGVRAAQLLFREGYREEGLARLRPHSQADRLDGALARWIGGGSDEDLRSVLVETCDAVERFAVSPSLGAAAAGWLALLEASSGGAGLPAALAALERGLAWAPPDSKHGPSLALLKAWVLGSLGKTQAALAALPDDPRAASARAALQLELGLGEVAEPALADQVPLGAAWRARHELLDAREAKASPEDRAARSVPFRVGLALGGPRKEPGAEPLPVAVPVASELLPGSRQLLAARLYLEGARLLPSLRSKESAPAARETAQRILERAVGLAPHHVLARLELIKLGGPGISALAEEYPYLDEVLRIQVRVELRGVKEAGERKRILTSLAPSFQALSLSPSARTNDLLDAARVARMTGDHQRAWEVLQGPLAEEHRTREIYREAVDLAKRLKRPELPKLEAALEEIHETFRTYKQLFAQAETGEGDSLNTEAAPALKRLHRDLPLTAYYYDKVAQAQFGEGAWALANLSGGRYLLTTRSMHSGGLSMWLYAFGWSKEAPQDLVFEFGAAEAKKDRFDPAPHLGRAMFLAARATLSRGKQPEDLWRALRYTRLALELKPDCHGALCLAYFLTVSARLDAEGTSYATRARASDPDSAFISFHEGRLAALKGDWRRTLEIYRGIKLAKSSRRLIKEAPSFQGIAGRKEWADFVAEQQAQ